MALDDKTVEELKAKHGNELVEVAGLVFKRPDRSVFDRWFDQMQVDKSKSTMHARELATACLVYPDQQAFRAVIDARPGLLPIQILNAITDLAGFLDGSEDSKPKKL